MSHSFSSWTDPVSTIVSFRTPGEVHPSWSWELENRVVEQALRPGSVIRDSAMAKVDTGPCLAILLAVIRR